MDSKLTPLVSICVQTYNQEHYIKECLDGILMQRTNFPFEIILGEDESSDGTREICIAYGGRHSDKIRLFLRSRKDVIYIDGNATGRYNFIENLKECKGKYIALCEGDDYWTDPLKLQQQFDFMEANEEYAGCFHNTDVINELVVEDSVKPWRTYSKKHFDLADTLSKRSLFHTSSFVFRSSNLEVPSWFEQVQSGDMALFAIIASKGPLYRVDETMSVYRKNVTGITNSITEKSYHSKRISLYMNIKEYLAGREEDRCEGLIKFHKKKLSDFAISKTFGKKLLDYFKKGS